MVIPFSRPLVLLATIILGTLTLRAATSDLPPLNISPADPGIRYIGRFEFPKNDSRQFEWTGSSETIRFKSSSVNAILSGSNIRLQVVLDGVPKQTIKLDADRIIYKIADGLPADREHTLELFRATEAAFGDAFFKGFQLEKNGVLLPPPPASSHRIEFIGDSITCGYGNESSDPTSHFSIDTENGYYSYAALAARTCGAEAIEICRSGIGLQFSPFVPSPLMPELYTRVLCKDPSSEWDFKQWIPQVVVINLGTNDFAKGIPDPKVWDEKYRAFLKVIRTNYPDSHIYCCVGPMLHGEALAVIHEYITTMVKDLNKAGDVKIHGLEFEPQKPEDGLGSDFHPSIKTDQIMAAKLSEVIQRDLGW